MHKQKGQHRAPQARSRKRRLLILPLLVLPTGFVLAVFTIAWLLWPRWPAPDQALDAPALPVTISGVAFNIPTNAIRLKAQRKSGVQERVDLVFMWPSLEAPDERPEPVTAPEAIDRIFLTISGSDGTLGPVERLDTIYPRYLVEGGGNEGGLTLRAFRDGTPYHGEEVLYDPADRERFIVRCTKDAGSAIGMCLQQRRIGTVDVMIRFPRQWLSDWQGVRDNIEKLLARVQMSQP